ncbi:dynein assembly factor with WDR repeat domains 1 [Marchantia polymorpha subsp. ruderalis]|uniref:RING-type domain-containing protein n=2 Tax=Marchantia polymorpha TaxID=3197 RepID=A0A2R6XIP1_MARPO|nr:hypothetical protein MARPO_0013s0144 [Marchantia polymorpha]BBN18903.1 hypothetical protein Mp_8g06460 [Marchantia polymorpha subsp. ruderalis]|eukprot:PTQ45939.1 hypothetical protein MARPO_0013s0144 [Marchantia polymorpha]
MALITMGLTCKICFERASDQEGGLQARITPCGHVFCTQCAAIWFRSDASCPVCRYAIPAPSALIPLYDHDSGIQSPSYGFDEKLEVGETVVLSSCVGESPEDSVSGDAQNDGSKRNSKKGGSGNSEHHDRSESKKEKCGDGFSNDRSALAMLFQKTVSDEEDVQVKFVLGKLAEHWQQVVVERAKLKVQVAKLEKLKADLSAQVESLSEENMVLKQALVGSRFRPTPRSSAADSSAAWDAENDVSYSGESTFPGFDVDIDSTRAHFHPSMSLPDLSCTTETSISSTRGTRRPPAKVEERLGATKWELGHTFSMHSGPVHGIAVSPSGNLVATASWDHLCRVYDVHLEEEVSVLAGHLLGLYAVKFSPAKRDLVGTVSSDHTCRLWNTDNGECLRVLEGHTDEVNGLSFKQGTHLLATASDDKSSMIWDAEKGIPVTTLKGHRNGVYGVCFQPLGHLVATASFDFTAKLWDPRSAVDVQTLRGHQEDVIGVDIDDSGLLLATGSDDKTCRVWDLRMGSPLAVLQEHSGEVKRVCFSPFGKLLATTSGDTTVRLFNTSTFECLHILSSHSDHVFDAAWSPTADFLVTASHDRLWKLWQPKSSLYRASSLNPNFNRLRLT